LSEDQARRARRDLLLQPLRSRLIPIPGDAPGVCATCHSGCSESYEACYHCNAARKAVSLPPFVPITMSVESEQMHFALRHYKDDTREDARSRLSNQLAALLSEFVELHSACLGDVDSWIPVPSTKRRAPAGIVGRVASLNGRVADVLTPKRTLGRGEFDAGAFALTGSGNSGSRAVVFDDTFTTGSAVFSAAAALQAQGTEVAAVVVIGRHVKPSFLPNAALLEWLRDVPWSPDCCVLCGPATRPGALF
jgi:hypothetical protein